MEDSKTDRKTVWVFGRWPIDPSTEQWEVMGFFSTREAAVAGCKIPERDFVASLELDVLLPDETYEWPDCEYPLPLEDDTDSQD